MIPALVFHMDQALSAKDFAAKCADLSKARDWAGLEALARAQAAASPKDASAQAALGFALLAQGKKPEGKAACEAALKLDPKQMQALFYLGVETAQEGDRDGTLAIAKRIESIKPLVAVQFTRNPAVQHALVPGTDMPLVEPGQVHLKAASMGALQGYLSEAANGRLAVAVIALSVDAEGVPTMAETLLASPGLLAPQIEKNAIECRVEPLKINGKPAPFRFIFDLSVNRPGDGGM